MEHALLAAIPWAGLPALEALLCVVLLLVLDWRLALLALCVFPLSLAGPRFFAARATAASYDRKQHESHVLGALHESLGAQAAVKAFGLEARLLERFAERLRTLAGSSTRTAFLGALVERSASIGILILHVIVLGVGTLMTLDGQMSIGSLVSFQALFLTLSWSLSYVAQYAPNLVLASGAMRRIEELFAVAPHVADAADAVALPRFAREIRFEHVTFGHDADRLSLADVSFEVRAGERIAIVGGVGSGKSTLLKMLTRFRDPRSGRILVDGHDLRSVSQASLRSQIGLVFQEGYLFDGSIRENIRLGRLDATDSEIEAVAGLIGLHDQIQHLPDGYDTRVGLLGDQLSGGQRQLVAIARAVLRDPPILILDEPTSALDSRAAAVVDMTLDLVARGRTLLAVTHVLASAQHADRILVMSEGRLAEQGRHDELLAHGRIYAQLWSRREGTGLSRQTSVL